VAENARKKSEKTCDDAFSASTKRRPRVVDRGGGAGMLPMHTGYAALVLAIH